METVAFIVLLGVAIVLGFGIRALFIHWVDVSCKSKDKERK